MKNFYTMDSKQWKTKSDVTVHMHSDIIKGTHTWIQKVVQTCTFANAKMEKHSTERGLNLYLWPSKTFAASETSTFSGSLDLLELWAAVIDILHLDEGQDKSSFGTSWLGRAPAFLSTSTIVGCLYLPLSSEFDFFEFFLFSFFLFWEESSFDFKFSRFFPVCSIWLGPLEGDGDKGSTWG